jgi:hypothetical protein
MLRNDFNLKLWFGRVRFASAILVIAAVAWAGWELATRQWPGLEPEKATRTKITVSPLAVESHFKVEMLAPEELWMQNEPHTLRLELENDGAEPGKFDLFAVPAAEDCLRVKSTQGLLIAANTATTIELPVDASQCAGRSPSSSPIQLRYSWSLLTATKSPARNFGGFLSTSPITVTTPFAESLERYLRILTSVARDFTWPVLLAVVGFFGQKALARRGEQQQILNTLLPTLTDLMQNHYLSIVRRMQRVALEAENIQVPAPPESVPQLEDHLPLRRTFAAILQLRKRMLYLANSKGGVFFRSAIAEDIFASGVSAFYSRFQQGTGDPDLCEAIADALDANALPHVAFQQIFFPFLGRAKVEGLLRGFAGWSLHANGGKTEEFQQYLILLDLCQGVLSFEFDRVFYHTEYRFKPIFSNWYFDPPRFEFSGDINRLPAAVRSPNVEPEEDMVRQFTLYLNGMPPECRVKIKYPA